MTEEVEKPHGWLLRSLGVRITGLLVTATLGTVQALMVGSGSGGKVVGLEVSSVGRANHPQKSGTPGLLVGRGVHGKVVRGVGWAWL